MSPRFAVGDLVTSRDGAVFRILRHVGDEWYLCAWHVVSRGMRGSAVSGQRISHAIPGWELQAVRTDPPPVRGA